MTACCQLPAILNNHSLAMTNWNQDTRTARPRFQKEQYQCHIRWLNWSSSPKFMLICRGWRNSCRKNSKIPQAKVIELGKCKNKGSTPTTSAIEPRSSSPTSTFIRDGLKLHLISPKIRASLLVKQAVIKAISWTVGHTVGVNFQTIRVSSRSKVHGAVANYEMAKYQVWHRRAQGQALNIASINTTVFSSLESLMAKVSCLCVTKMGNNFSITMDNFRKENSREGANTSVKNTYILEVLKMVRRMEKGICQSVAKA